ncbi:uncharacterized protein GJ701_005014 [Geothlypis trichas]
MGLSLPSTALLFQQKHGLHIKQSSLAVCKSSRAVSCRYQVTSSNEEEVKICQSPEKGLQHLGRGSGRESVSHQRRGMETAGNHRQQRKENKNRTEGIRHRAKNKVKKQTCGKLEGKQINQVCTHLLPGEWLYGKTSQDA